MGLNAKEWHDKFTNYLRIVRSKRKICIFLNVLWVGGSYCKGPPTRLCEHIWNKMDFKLTTLNSKGCNKKYLKQKIDKLDLRATIRF